MKTRVLWVATAACVLILGAVFVCSWPTASAQPLPGVAVEFVSGSYTVGEADGTVTITVTLSQSSSSTVTVDYTTTEVTATAGWNYTTTTGTLSFSPGQTSKTITVPILDTACCDGNQDFTVDLSNPSGASLGTTGTTGVTILDDDVCN